MYSHQIAQQDYEKKCLDKGAPLKIGKDHALVTYIADKIRNHKYSPAAVLDEIRVQGLQFDTTISHTTLYRYIATDLLYSYGLTNNDLPVNKRKKKKHKRERRISYLNPLEKSIEDSPKDILSREEFGHWEMDTAVGKAKGKSTKAPPRS